ncbi:hypothetical protein J2W83_004816 [Pseudomonas hunanensis]|uniref:Uncharacterized protein n=1 Tax=Pseudomonas hunanensis TaxID=1247546 RepID=A0ACC6K9S3_9PSED|nr:acyltransferase [Pseudomonas hunanensis]MDR6715176.1 hypothetical protein [Pseudomonas hunanensis]
MSVNVIEVRGQQRREPWRLSGIDTMVESWADYLLVYDYVLDPHVVASHLARALDINPYFAGRKMTLEQGLVVSGNNEGARLEYCRIDGPLPNAVLAGCYDDIDAFCARDWREQHRLSRTSLKQPLLQVRLSVFEDATVIAFSVWHGLSDGTTFFQFLELLARLACAKAPAALPEFVPLQARSGPVPDDALVDRWQRPRDEQVSGAFAERAFILSDENIAWLLSGCTYQGFMRQDFLIGYIWRLIVATEDADAQGDVTLYPVYDARQLIEISSSRVGNLLCYPTVRAQAQQVMNMPLPELAALVRQAAGQRVLECEALQGELEAICAVVEEGEKGRYLLRPLYESLYGRGVLFNNLTGMPWQRFDLGHGAPIHVDAPMHDPMRFVQFFPCLSRPDAITVKINLPQAHLKRFAAAFAKELES